MGDLAVWQLGLLVATVEALIIVLIVRTRVLVLHLLAMVEPWLGGGDGEEVEQGRVAVRDARGRFVRWETVTAPAGTRGLRVEPPSSPPSDMGGVPVQELLAKWQEGKLSRADILPYLPTIMGRLKQEFTPSGGGGGAPDTRSRFG